MNAPARLVQGCAAALLVPVVGAIGLGVAGATLLLDLLATPWVARARRRRRPDEAPPPRREASVVVLNWNRLRYLAELLPSLLEAVDAAPGNHEVVVVDNGSTDGSPAFVRERFPRVRLVGLPENRFFVRGIEAGVEVATRDILVLLNNDLVVERDFLARLLERFGEADLFAVTARIRLREPDAAPVETGKTRAFVRRGELEWLQTPILAEEPPLVPAAWAGGGSSAFDRRKFLELGGFDRLFEPLYVEDVSLSYSAWRRGWRILLEPRSVVHHAHRGTSAEALGLAAVERIDRRNRHLFFWKHVTDPGLLLAHAAYLPWNLLKRARRTGLRLELRALFAALARLPLAWTRRPAQRAAARRSDREALAVANHVALHRRSVRGHRARRERPRVLLLTTQDRTGSGDSTACAVELLRIPVPVREPEEWLVDLHGRIPARFRRYLADAAARDLVRFALADRDFDLLHAGDLFAGALAAPLLGGLQGIPSLLEARPLATAGGLLERAREENFLVRVSRPFSRILCATRIEEEALARVSPGLRHRLATEEGGPAAARLYDELLA
ncbi:MAG TPA: glycosyltransferase family 2 protein [Planctomycetota bacterium]|jgi:GT2 family glycosyltransferase|nr:glycosyltransferase family 2 protein [Planctomycetota bacterium]